MHDENEQFEELPQSLIDELKRVDKPLPLITARVDRDIAVAASAHFAARDRSLLKPAWRAGLAIAATVLIAMFLVLLRGPVIPPSGGMYADVDHSGRVDIADVLALARDRKANATQADLDAFAKRVVSLRHAGDAS